MAERPSRTAVDRNSNLVTLVAEAPTSIVVGAGITGLMTAVLLARAGKDVLVLEARTVGACASGNTTAKISLLQGSHLSKILSKHGPEIARAYVDGNREGQSWVLDHCESHGVGVQREDAYTYAQSGDGVRIRTRRVGGVPSRGSARHLGSPRRRSVSVPRRSAPGRASAIRSDGIPGRAGRRTARARRDGWSSTRGSGEFLATERTCSST